MGAYVADHLGGDDAGSSYVVFGKADTTTVDLATLGSSGFRIDGAAEGDRSGASVSGAGDVNGDGLDDLIVDAYGTGPIGVSYVVFGKADTTTVDLSTLGSRGFRIDVACRPRYDAGDPISGAGDVNGDGLNDLIVCGHGASYVVFGKADPTTVNVATLGSRGFQINPADITYRFGVSVSGAGDINGDGLSDLIVGADRADPGGERSAGSSFVVFGKADTATVDVATLGSLGLRIDGAAARDNSGGSVSGAGDVNGDGLSDLIVGADGASPDDRFGAGASYVVFSPETPPPSATYRGYARNGDAAERAVGVIGDGSNDGTPDARAWLDFDDGEVGGAPASSHAVTLYRHAPPSFAFPASVFWHVETNREAWSTVGVQFKYLDSEIDGADETQLELYRADSVVGPWTRVASTVDINRNRISADVDELGYFAIGTPGTTYIDPELNCSPIRGSGYYSADRNIVLPCACQALLDFDWCEFEIPRLGRFERWIPRYELQGWAQWQFLPELEGVSEIHIETSGWEGTFDAEPTLFESDLTPGEPAERSFEFQMEPGAMGTRVRFETMVDGEPSEVEFMTRFPDAPEQ